MPSSGRKGINTGRSAVQQVYISGLLIAKRGSMAMAAEDPRPCLGLGTLDVKGIGIEKLRVGRGITRAYIPR